MVFKEVLALFFTHTYLISFLAGFLSEDLLLLLAIASGGSRLDFFALCIFGFIGVVIHDTVIYVFAHIPLLKRWIMRMEQKESHKPLVRFIERLGRGDYVIPLCISKFIYGTRVALILYFGHKEKRFWRFFCVNTFAVFLWFLVMMPIGWLAGRGFTQVLGVVRGVEKALGMFVVFIVLAVILNAFFKRVLLKIRH